MIISVEDTRKWFIIGITAVNIGSDDIKLGAGETCQVDISDEFEVFIPMFRMHTDGLHVVGVGDEEGIVGIAAAAGVLSGGGQG